MPASETSFIPLLLEQAPLGDVCLGSEGSRRLPIVAGLLPGPLANQALYFRLAMDGIAAPPVGSPLLPGPLLTARSRTGCLLTVPLLTTRSLTMRMLSAETLSPFAPCSICRFPVLPISAEARQIAGRLMPGLATTDVDRPLRGRHAGGLLLTLITA